MVENQDNPKTRSPMFVFRYLAPPVFSDAEKTRLGRLLNTVVLILFAATLAAYATAFSTPNPGGVFAAISAMLVVEIVSFILLRRGLVRASATLLCSGLWLILFGTSIVGAGITNSPFIALVIVVVIAGLLMGGTAGFLFAALTMASGLVLMMLELGGLLPEPLIPFNLVGFWIALVVVFFLVAGLIYMTTRNLKEEAGRARQNELAQLEINRELQTMRASLEEQVDKRTQALERQSSYLLASVEVSRATSSILDIDQLFQETVNVVREQFELYYVGLFQLDESGEWAVLRAGTGEAGRAMLARGHRIRVGKGMIGWSIANAQPRVALETGEDAVRLATPELPQTLSEAAIPLRSRGRILGALTVQSDKPGAFGETEIAAFQGVADQVAVALDNARLFNESQQALLETQRAYGEISRGAWADYLRGSEKRGYRYDPITKTLAVAGPPNIDEKQPTFQSLDASTTLRSNPDGGTNLTLPIMVRDQVIGALNLTKTEAEESWTEEELALLRSIVDQLGLSLDSARLYRDAQRLALQERLTGEITSRMRETLDIETVLTTALDEIFQAMDLENLVIQLAPQNNGDVAGIQSAPAGGGTGSSAGPLEGPNENLSERELP